MPSLTAARGSGEPSRDAGRGRPATHGSSRGLDVRQVLPLPLMWHPSTLTHLLVRQGAAPTQGIYHHTDTPHPPTCQRSLARTACGSSVFFALLGDLLARIFMSMSRTLVVYQPPPHTHTGTRQPTNSLYNTRYNHLNSALPKVPNAAPSSLQPLPHSPPLQRPVTRQRQHRGGDVNVRCDVRHLRTGG